MSLIPGKYTPPAPPTVDSPDRPIRYLTLAEAIAIALEQGNVGSQNPLFPGIGLDQNNVTAQAVFSDSIRVISLDPAITGANIERSLSKFDAAFVSNISWNKNDTAIANGLQSFQNGDSSHFDTGFYKPLPTGGVAGITFNTDYNKLQSSANVGGFQTLNPSWKPRLNFAFEQPLLRDFGVEINQLNPNGPRSLLNQQLSPFTNALSANGAGTEGILVSRLRYDQTKADFERQLNFMLVNVEYAYWNLYAAYGNLYARDAALIESVDLWKVIKNRFDQGIAKPHEEARARAQVEAFRAQRYTALGTVIDNERQLRALLGMGFEGTRLVPIDVPTLAPFTPDWQMAIDEAMMNRPELTIARQDLKFRQFDIMVQKNQLKGDLRFIANYDINGIGTQLDGGPTKTIFTPDGLGGFTPAVVPQNALSSFTSNTFNNWQVGLRYAVPLGFRDAHGAVRIARLNLVRSYASLKDTERKVEEQVRVYYARLNQFYRTIQAQKAAYKASAEEYTFLEARRDLDLDLPSTLEQMLNAQQTKVAALAAEYQAIADYNNTLSGFQFAKGTILQYNNVNISDGPLPAAAAVRATDHLRERTRALMVRERPDEAVPTGNYPINVDPAAALMPRAEDVGPQSVPDMMRNMPKPTLPSEGSSRCAAAFAGAARSVPPLPAAPPVTPVTYPQ